MVVHSRYIWRRSRRGTEPRSDVGDKMFSYSLNTPMDEMGHIEKDSIKYRYNYKS